VDKIAIISQIPICADITQIMHRDALYK